MITADQMARLCTWQTREASESLQEYGSRVLQFLIAYAITAPLADEDLELADHVAIYAVAARDVSPIALQSISDTRHLIATVLRLRKRERESEQTTMPPVTQERPNVGPMAPLSPVPIVRPPAPSKAQFDF